MLTNFSLQIFINGDKCINAKRIEILGDISAKFVGATVTTSELDSCQLPEDRVSSYKVDKLDNNCIYLVG